MLFEWEKYTIFCIKKQEKNGCPKGTRLKHFLTKKSENVTQCQLNII